MPNITAASTCTTAEIATILGISDRRVQQLTKQGVIKQQGRNEYNISEAVQKYISSIQGNTKKEFQEERTKLTKANREKAEIELQMLRGEIHHSEDVKKIMFDMLSAFRSRLLAIPVKAAPPLTAETELLAVQNILKAEIYDALSELSEYDPAKFYRQSRERVTEAGQSDADNKKKAT